MMLCGLVIIFGCIPAALSYSNNTSDGDSNVTDTHKALENISDMQREILRFYKQWDSLSRRIAAQGKGRAMEICTRDHTAECTTQKRRELTTCITDESNIIHDQVVVIYDQKLRKPWEAEFEKLKEILLHPECHSISTVNETIWTVGADNVSEESVRYRFYNSLVNFQSPPELYPIDKVYQLCLDRLFTKYRQLHIEISPSSY